jgi:excisionase family DNA binding protein
MPELLSVREASLELRLSISTLRSWISQRKIRFVRLGRRVLLRRGDLEALINKGVVEAKQ